MEDIAITTIPHWRPCYCHKGQHPAFDVANGSYHSSLCWQSPHDPGCRNQNPNRTLQSTSQQICTVAFRQKLTNFRIVLFIQDTTLRFLVVVFLNPFKEAGKFCDLSLQDTATDQTVTMRATVTVQLLTLTKFVKLKQKIIKLNSE